MVIEWDFTVDEASQNIIYDILYGDPGFQMNPMIKNILMAAQASDEKKGYVRITNSIHTNFDMMRKSAKNNTFVPYWFNLTGSYMGETFTAETGKSLLHFYIGMYILTNDAYGNMYYYRYNINADDSLGYIPRYLDFNQHLIIKWFPTGRVTDSHLYNDEIVMYGGGGPGSGRKKKVKTENNTTKPEEIIPVKIVLPRTQKDEDKMEKKMVKKIIKREKVKSESLTTLK